MLISYPDGPKWIPNVIIDGSAGSTTKFRLSVASIQIFSVEMEWWSPMRATLNVENLKQKSQL